MCITLYLKKTFRVLRDKLGRQYGWKVFCLIQNGKYGGDYCGYRTVRPRGKWLKAQDFTPEGSELSCAMRIYDYEPGWHVFKKKKDAVSWGSLAITKEIVKVLVREVREKGYVWIDDAHVHCFIADEIFIPK